MRLSFSMLFFVGLYWQSSYFSRRVAKIRGAIRARSLSSCRLKCQLNNLAQFSEAENQGKENVFIFGLGYIGTALAYHLKSLGWNVAGTVSTRSKGYLYKATELRKKGIKTYFHDPNYSLHIMRINELLQKSSHVLCTVPPVDKVGGADATDEILTTFKSSILQARDAGTLKWIGYISSTGVYGDCRGAWITEADPVRPANAKTAARVTAENRWLALSKSTSSPPVSVFRLAGVYGPGRSALETIRKAGGDIGRCAPDDQTITSRIHVTDIVRILSFSMNLTSTLQLSGVNVFNLADDQPCTRLDVLRFAARLMNVSVSPIQSGTRRDDSEEDMRLGFEPRVRGGSKRVDNFKISQLLSEFGLKLQYADYKSGLVALAGGDLGPFDQNFSSPCFSPVAPDDLLELDDVNSASALQSPSHPELTRPAGADDVLRLKERVDELQVRVATLEGQQRMLKMLTLQQQQLGGILIRDAHQDTAASNEIQESEDSYVCIFPDELPTEHNDLIDVLRSALAPLKAWRQCAVEYHRQGYDIEFESILNDIVVNLENKEIESMYRGRDDFSEGITEIFIALAANALLFIRNHRRANPAPSSSSSSATSADPVDGAGADPVVAEFARKTLDYIQKADREMRMNEYTWLVKGFYEVICSGEMKNAETLFQSVFDRASKGTNAAWKKFLYGSSVGMGLVLYHKGNYAEAQNFFKKAIITNPNCDPSVRLAFGCCCFKLEQFERATLAASDVIAKDPTNLNALVVLALLEQVVAKKDRQKRVESRNCAFDYCMLVCTIDSKHAAALNQLANHYFHTWQLLLNQEEEDNGREDSVRCAELDREHILLTRTLAHDISVMDHIRISNSSTVHSVVEIFDTVATFLAGRSIQTELNLEKFVVLRISPPLKSDTRDGKDSADLSIVPVRHLDWKELNRVERLAQQALQSTSIPPLVAESNLMLGKVAHAKGNLVHAFEFYRRASRDLPDLSVALFGQAEILFVRQEFPQALELFEKLAAKHAEDKDTQAYVALLKAMLKQQLTSFDKLREIAPGFQYEVDLWLLQAQLREKNLSEYIQALRCYMFALDRIEEQKGSRRAAPAAVLSNISVLHHSLNKLDKALEFSILSLQAASDSSSAEEDDQTAAVVQFSCSEFEDVFYVWSEEICQVVFVNADADGGGFTFETVTGQSVNLPTVLTAGHEVLLNDVRLVVRSITANTLVCLDGAIPVTSLVEGTQLTLRVKKSLRNFRDSTVTYCYNFARLLEDNGSTNAAVEVYIGLLKRHPSFIECYLRLSLIACEKGKFDDATAWLSRALEVNSEEPDVNICLGDLYYRNSLADDARKCYEKMSTKDKRESRAMLSLGNFYFARALLAKGGSDATGAAQFLKDSYKFFHHVLVQDMTNAYAANGLGMVCVEKLEIDTAKEIFAKAREANLTLSEDISTNLAHTYMMQNRLVDAEKLYETTLKNLARSNRGSKSSYLFSCMSFAQFKHHRYRDSVKSLLRSIHLNPSYLRDWYNIGIVSEIAATSTIAASGDRGGDKSGGKTVQATDILHAKNELIFARDVFHSLGRINVDQKQQLNYDKKSALSHEAVCQANVSVFDEHLASAEEEEEKRRLEHQRREEEHRQRQAKKFDEQALALEQMEIAKKEKQLLAAQRQRKLEELQEKWVSTVPSTAEAGEGGAAGTGHGKRKRAAGGGSSRGKKSKGVDSEEEVADSTNDVEKAERSKPLPSDLFGSSDEEDDSPSVKETGSNKNEKLLKKKSLNTEIFGDSSDEESVSQKQVAVAAKKPKRLLKQRSQAGDGASDDDEAMDMEPTPEGQVASDDLELDNSSKLELNSSKRSRVITDSDDDET